MQYRMFIFVEKYKYLGVHLDNKLDCTRISVNLFKQDLFPVEALVLQCLQHHATGDLQVCGG